VTENEIGKVVVDAALKVHPELRPGLIETVSEVVPARELENRGGDDLSLRAPCLPIAKGRFLPQSKRLDEQAVLHYHGD